MKNTNKKDIKQYLFVINELTSREVKRKYARSYLGIIWSVLNPLLSMAVISLVFSQMFARNIEKFPVFYLTGSVLWALFANSTNAAMTSLADNKSLLMKTKLPMVIFPLTRTVTALINFGYSLIAYLLILIVFRVPFNWCMPMFFVYAALLFVFSLGMGYLLSVLYVYFADIQHLYGVILSLWIFLSAIFYPLESIPVEVQKIVRENPVYNYISAARKCVLEGTLPDAGEWLRMMLWAVGMYAVGKLVFNKMKHNILQRI